MVQPQSSQRWYNELRKYLSPKDCNFKYSGNSEESERLDGFFYKGGTKNAKY
jgi:hypothetical protein